MPSPPADPGTVMVVRAWACISVGDALPWLGAKYFTWVPSSAGSGKNISTQHNITGHKWVNNCGDA